MIDIEELHEALDTVKDQLPQDIREEAEKALKLLEIDDIEMAAVRVGRIIERILTNVLDSLTPEQLDSAQRVKNDKCLESMLGRLRSSSYDFPSEISSYVELIRKFRNDAAHDGSVSEHAISTVVESLRGIIVWYISSIDPDEDKLINQTLFREIVKSCIVDDELNDKEVAHINNKRLELNISKAKCNEIIKEACADQGIKL